ncbi:MAG TPA: hypothetical protein VGR56_10740 [Nitrososphaerales archaeon]|nr:hypothetical protein [Nitrososphaerales archaeon]
MRSLIRGAFVSYLLVGLLLFSSAAFAETETETHTGQYLRFSLIPSPLPGGTVYQVGNGSAVIWAQGTFLSVHLYARGMARSAHFMLVLVANGTSHSVANMTTNYDGEVEAEAEVALGPGVYAVGLKLFDTSTFSSPTLVLIGSPTTQTLSILQTTAQTTTTTREADHPVTTVLGGNPEEDDIRSAIQTKVIPAVVDVGVSGSSVSVNDANFSVSVGMDQQNGYQVSISAANVAGPRVLMINMTSAQARNLFSSPVQVILDGVGVSQAATLSQVLGAQASDPARFVLVSSNSALKLLISIPHFSYHTIEIIPILVHIGSALVVDLPVLILSVTAVSMLVVVVNSRRTRVSV